MQMYFLEMKVSNLESDSRSPASQVHFGEIETGEVAYRSCNANYPVHQAS